MTSPDPHAGLALFGLPEPPSRVEPVSEGYINDTFKVWAGDEPVYILQRINTAVFGDPAGLMGNLEAVLPHLRATDYTPLELIRTPEGRAWAKDRSGNAWRMYRFIPGSRTLQSASDPHIAREAGRILGRFHQLAEAVPAASLHPTLPRFHDLGWRLEQLNEAEQAGLAARRETAASWTLLARSLAALCQEIPWEHMPLRTCHNDTKLSNILFAEGSDRALCLIDLDTLMPGYLLYDVGDAVRTLMNPLPEDHPDWEAIRARPELFRAFVQGLKQSGLALEPSEREALPYGVVLMPLLHGIRALADYLLGDRYYKTTYPEQNLVRACNLLQFARCASEQLGTLREICREEGS